MDEYMKFVFEGGGMMPAPEGNDESERYGCANAVGTIIGMILGFALCALCSCSTHRNACEIGEIDADSLALYMEQHNNVAKKDSTVSLFQSTSKNQSAKVDVRDEEEVETVTEHITEFTDSAGNKTKTTDRTTTKKRKVKDEKQSLLETYSDLVDLNLRLSAFDSAYMEYKNLYQKSYQERFDKQIEEQKEKKRSGFSVLWRFFLGTLAILLVLRCAWWGLQHSNRKL